MQADIDLARNGRVAFRAAFITILAGALVLVVTGQALLSCLVGAMVFLLRGYDLWIRVRADRFPETGAGRPQGLPPGEAT